MLLRCESLEPRMSLVGLSRRFGCFGQPSACPLRIRKRPNRCAAAKRCSVPIPAVSRCSKILITSSPSASNVAATRRMATEGFAERALRNIRLMFHSALMLAARITLPHFSISAAMSFPKSAGEPVSTVPPRSEIRAFNDRLGADVGAATRAVFYDELLAEPPREPRSDEPRKNVGQSAGGRGGDNAHRPRRIGLAPMRCAIRRAGRQHPRRDGENFDGEVSLSPTPLQRYSITSSARSKIRH